MGGSVRAGRDTARPRFCHRASGDTGTALLPPLGVIPLGVKSLISY